ncbi:GDYXXLXY domain-containing protein [Flavobacterium sp.]|uniref:GDYXXLXY domain-containing protein n=1 Tax=Flavobacterium sp. TaxID=239 RepID=UPI0040333F8C
MKISNKLLIAGFVLTALAQIAVPAKMMYDCEMTERHGTEYKFRTEPIDPADPFRGKYITLSFDNTVYLKDTIRNWNKDAYVYIIKDKDGFAKVTNVSCDPINSKKDFFKAKAWGYNGMLHIEFPFDRYYMEEGKAYEAELAYRDYSRRDSLEKPAYAVVAVKDGHSVLKDVIVDGKPIRDYVLEQREIKKDE